MTEKVDILLVDDRLDGIFALEAVLTSPEYNLVRATSGVDALSQILSTDFALILMDVQMPDMDGFEVARIIKQREKSKRIPIIFMTAINKTDQFISMGYSVGAVDYLFKPFDPHILRSKVAVFVELYKKSRLVLHQGSVLLEVEQRERARTLADLEAESRRRYRNLADAIPQIVWRLNNSGEVEYFNQFWQQYTGWPVEESLRGNWRNIFHPEDLAVFEKHWRVALETKLGFDCDCRLLSGTEKQYRWHLFRVVPETSQARELPYWISTATDIHDKKMIQEELAREKKKADLANETKSRFLANMSHEIRTPLGAILGFADLLNDPNVGVAERAEWTGTIRRNGEQLSKIIDEILDLSKVEAGKLDVERTEVNIVDLLNGVKDLMSMPAQKKGLQLEFQIKGTIPRTIFTNEMRVRQILINIIGNAVKFSSSGGITVTIFYQSGRLFCHVRDSGPGLSSHEIKNLFQPFSQGDSSVTRKFGGTGLGLALSRRLARALGGDVLVKETVKGTGSTFEIFFETGEVRGAEFVSTFGIGANPSTDLSPLLAEKLDGAKILLVEDSIDNQILVDKYLSMSGAIVEIAGNGKEGVEKALLNNYDVVLMDIQMPVLDGYGAIKQLRKQSYNGPVIALTAHGMIEERERCFELGFNDHLTKPVDRRDLVRHIQRLMPHTGMAIAD
jgi:two-component system, sensor histidine kinase